MKEIDGSDESRSFVKTKSSSGCLIVEKKAGAFSVGGKFSGLSKDKKRARVVLSDSESSDELGEPVRRKVYKFSTGLVESDDLRMKKKVKGNVSNEVISTGLAESDELRVKKKVKDVSNELFNTGLAESDELRVKKKVKNVSSEDFGTGLVESEDLRIKKKVKNVSNEDFGRGLVESEDLRIKKKVKIASNEIVEKRLRKDVDEGPRRLMLDKRNVDKKRTGVDKEKEVFLESKSGRVMDGDDDNEDEDIDEGVGLALKNGGLKVKRKESRSGVRPPSLVKVLKRDGNANVPTKNEVLVKGKESKIKGASTTEKQLLREKIKKMLFDAGWTIDYRPRRNRDYLDSVYMSPGGTGYWSITKAYEALQKEERDKSKASGDFTPLPYEVLNKLTRNTRKKAERAILKNIRREGISEESKRVKVKKFAHNAASGNKQMEKLGSLMRHSRKLSESRSMEASEESDDCLSDNSEKKAPRKDALKKSTVHPSSQIVHGRKSGIIGRLTLMGRGSEKGQHSEHHGFVPYSGKRTMLSWLIDSGMVSVGEKVEYMNLRKTRVMEEGWITEDGIHCGCCSKIVTVLRFELHAGSLLRQPFQNIFIESGKSLIQCQIDAWDKQEESKIKGFHAVDVNGGDPNDDTCGLCGDGGDLICCDGCPSTFHLSCLDMQMLPQGDWHCLNCACKYCKVAGGHRRKASGRTATSLLTCHLCEKKYHKSCLPEMDDQPIDSSDLNLPFCGQKCQELYRSLQKLLWIKHELDSGFSWSLIHRSDPLPDVASANFSQRVECNSKLAIALSVLDECFLPIVDRRSGITLIHNIVYNCGSNFSRLNYSGFFTAILERGDEIICAASIRIHGSQLAEMPFIGTRDMYRRQGMCRRLLQAIESALSSLKVEKLVIPAIEEHMQTWTNAFSFQPLDSSQKKEMRSFNMLVFPGIDMLQKPLLKQDIQEGIITSEKGIEGVDVDDSNDISTKKSELNDAIMRNSNQSTRNPSDSEIQSSAKKSDAQSDANVLTSMLLDLNEATDATAGTISGSCSKGEAINLQNGNTAAIGIADVVSR
uniref:increased DNA methylation 1-like n=1 Tax=Erigeron canadensis TaxID=72917 RepID=UPI001CB926E2|nr:increased DNA methylation 1-like [Erigeron canadensis]